MTPEKIHELGVDKSSFQKSRGPILDLLSWMPETDDPAREIYAMLTRVQWCRRVHVLVHPGRPWVSRAGLLGKAFGRDYRLARRLVVEDGLLLTFWRSRQTKRRPKRSTGPDADAHITLQHDLSEPRRWTARIAYPDRPPERRALDVRRTDRAGGHLAALEQIISHVEGERVAIRVGAAVARLLATTSAQGAYRSIPLARAQTALRRTNWRWRAEGPWCVGERERVLS